MVATITFVYGVGVGGLRDSTRGDHLLRALFPVRMSTRDDVFGRVGCKRNSTSLLLACDQSPCRSSLDRTGTKTRILILSSREAHLDVENRRISDNFSPTTQPNGSLLPWEVITISRRSSFGHVPPATGDRIYVGISRKSWAGNVSEKKCKSFSIFLLPHLLTWSQDSVKIDQELFSAI